MDDRAEELLRKRKQDVAQRVEALAAARKLAQQLEAMRQAHWLQLRAARAALRKGGKRK